MTLTEVLAFLGVSSRASAQRADPGSESRLRDIRIDSRQVQPGDLFVAVPGKTFDGRNFVGQAVGNGAAAVLVATGDAQINISSTVPIIQVHDLPRKLPELAAYFYGYPSDVLKVIGITGTNGKTSCSHYIAQLMQAVGNSCGVMGTLGNGMLGNLTPSSLTTTDCCMLQMQLADILHLNAKYAAIEVTSVALDQRRVAGTSFDTAVFTNLSQDHLDYHGDMQEYFAAKLKLFTEYKPKNCVLNLDDAASAVILDKLSNLNYTRHPLQSANSNDSCHPGQSAKRVDPGSESCKSIYTYSINNPNADLYLQDNLLHTPWGSGVLNSPLIGQFNLSNLLACIACCALQGVALKDILAAVPNLIAVAGRMQRVTTNDAPQVVIDYAHTPDALIKVLQTLRAYKPAKLYCIFGCGGDRDRTKRPLMFQAALEYSDQVIITQDNSRTEDPQQIVQDMLQGKDPTDQVSIELDRANAIAKTIAQATKFDMILIAGKGHEDYQIIGTVKHPFSDLLVAKQALDNRS